MASPRAAQTSASATQRVHGLRSAHLKMRRRRQVSRPLPERGRVYGVRNADVPSKPGMIISVVIRSPSLNSALPQTLSSARRGRQTWEHVGQKCMSELNIFDVTKLSHPSSCKQQGAGTDRSCVGDSSCLASAAWITHLSVLG